MDGIITKHVGRCYCLILTNTLWFVADVIALADVIAMFCVLFLLLRLMFFYLIVECISCINKYRQMLKPWLMILPVFCGRCFKPLRQMLFTSFFSFFFFFFFFFAGKSLSPPTKIDLIHEKITYYIWFYVYINLSTQDRKDRDRD